MQVPRGLSAPKDSNHASQSSGKLRELLLQSKLAKNPAVSLMPASTLRQFADSYCHLVSRFSYLLGFDLYQIALLLAIIAGLCGIAFLASGKEGGVVNRFCPPWFYCLLLICALLLVRLPTFLPAANLNADEAVFLAGAMKLRHHPLFWQSLDGTSSGPLNYYPLTFLNILGLPLDFATARLVNVIGVGGAIAVVYRIARLCLPDWIARLTPLPPLAAAMAFRGGDFLHYSSECVPILLIAVATWLVFAENLSSRASRARGFAIGLIAFLLPFAKIQAAPMAATILVAGVANAFWRPNYKWRRLLYISAGLAAGFTMLLTFLEAFGLFKTFWREYVTNNFLHANEYSPVSLERFIGFCYHTSDVQWYESGIVALLFYVLAGSYYSWARTKGNKKTSDQFLQTALIATVLCGWGVWWVRDDRGLEYIIFAALVGCAVGTIRLVNQDRNAIGKVSFCDLFVLSLVAASLYAIYRPRSLFPHYLAFLILPLALVAVRSLAWSLPTRNPLQRADSQPAAVRTAIVFVLFTIGLPCVLRSKKLQPPFSSEAWMTMSSARFNCPACRLINHFAKPGEPVAIWGWAADLYVLTGTIPATRDTHTPEEFWMPDQQDYYRHRFLSDLQLQPPSVFVDAIGPGRFLSEREDKGYESFPELYQYIANIYHIVGDIDGVRVFIRTDEIPHLKSPIRIKCGSISAVTDENGNEWKADADFKGGQAVKFEQLTDRGRLPVLYRSERSCSTQCNYAIPVPSGSYVVRMYFTVLDHGGANQRAFDVEINDDTVALDLDIFHNANGRGKPYVLEHHTVVPYGPLKISLIPKLHEAAISAIEILPAQEAPPSGLQVKKIAEGESGALIDQVKWKADPAWTINSHYIGVGNLSTGKMWSSYGGDDGKTGRMISEPFASGTAGCLVVPVAHGPSVVPLRLALFDAASGRRIGTVPLDPKDEHWTFYQIRYDPFVTVRLLASDGGSAWGQWLGVGQPRSCK